MTRTRTLASIPKVAAVPIEDGRRRQYTLFEDLFGGTSDNVTKRGHPYSNSVGLLYEHAPKFVASGRAKAYIEQHSSKTNRVLRFLENHTVDFVFDGHPYQLEITPATVSRKNPETGEEEQVHLFPGFREQSVEQAIIKLAIDKKRLETFDAGAHGALVGARFNMTELRTELEKSSCGYKLAEIREALEVLHKAHIKITRVSDEDGTAEGEPEVSATLFPVKVVGRINKSTGDRETYVCFNPLVSMAIEREEWRQFNFQTFMALKAGLTRWIHKHLIHQWRNAAEGRTLTVRATTIIECSGLVEMARRRDGFAKIRRSFDELRQRGVLQRCDVRPIKGARGAVTDIEFIIEPSQRFVQEQKNANHQRNILDYDQQAFPQLRAV